MINIILNCFLSISLFISGGHILSSNFKSHHYSDEDYKDIFYLKNHNTVSKYCTKHSELENIKKIRSNNDGVDRTIYKVVKDVENISSTED
tara:strand:- start:992 stop:1264 length:273 start_codon:yes stop_codon:yes gene_type:complete